MILVPYDSALKMRSNGTKNHKISQKNSNNISTQNLKVPNEDGFDCTAMDAFFINNMHRILMILVPSESSFQALSNGTKIIKIRCILMMKQATN